jgi:1-deoxy-D-xylulose-5-phosphate reductoisomerase
LVVRMKRVAIFGSTGAIGRRTLEVIAHLQPGFRVTALVANRNVAEVARQARELKVRYAAVADERNLPELEQALRGTGIRALAGETGMNEIAASRDTDIVVMALAGTQGLSPTLVALEQRKRVAIATKEIIVAYGDFVMAQAKRSGAEILPIDSELSAIHQCLHGCERSEATRREATRREATRREVSRIILTASGGPFYRRRDLSRITVKQALNHPTWDMGRKITVDSATLMNKGLEAIETARYFGIEPNRIEVLIHPQSIVHSLVEFRDGSLLAQLALPDMRLPIQYALTYPQRLPRLVAETRLERLGPLTFSAPDLKRFPCLGLALKALRQGGVKPCVLNSANAVAVEAFLDGGLKFTQIPEVVAWALRRFEPEGALTLDELRLHESVARDLTLGRCRAMGRNHR